MRETERLKQAEDLVPRSFLTTPGSSLRPGGPVRGVRGVRPGGPATGGQKLLIGLSPLLPPPRGGLRLQKGPGWGCWRGGCRAIGLTGGEGVRGGHGGILLLSILLPDLSPAIGDVVV